MLGKGFHAQGKWIGRNWGTTERLHFHFSLSCIGEGNGNPLQYSCLENPRDREPSGLPSMGSHRVGHDWSDLAAAAAGVGGRGEGEVGRRKRPRIVVLLALLKFFLMSQNIERTLVWVWRSLLKYCLYISHFTWNTNMTSHYWTGLIIQLELL